MIWFYIELLLVPGVIFCTIGATLKANAIAKAITAAAVVGAAANNYASYNDY